jgi:replication fork protection complex subunit Csm3/Swi3
MSILITLFGKVALSVWHDEAKGLVNGVRLPTADDDTDSDEDSEADGATRDNETARAAAAASTTTADENAATSSTSPETSPTRSRLRHGGGDISVTSDSDRDIDALHLSSDDASRPPSSSPDRDEAAIELDALLEAEATHNATSTTGHAWKGTSNGDDDAIAMDEDEDLWDVLDLDTGAVAATAPATATTRVPPTMDDDDQEMWDIVHELEQEKKTKETATYRPDPVQVPPAASVARPETETDDLDDLYL